MKIAILLAVVSLAMAGAPRAQYVDREWLVGVQPDADFHMLLARNPRILLKNRFNLGKTMLLYVRASDVDIDRLRTAAEVKYVERNGIAYTTQCNSDNANGCWGLDRIDQAGQLGYNDPTDPSAVYNNGANDGAGASVYVLDTGIEVSHSDFGGRATFAYTAGGIANPGEDNNGHGTHCAGTVGSDSYGVAKGTSLLAVKVLGDSGSGAWSGIIEGMEWVCNSGTARSVISMSIGGGGITDSVGDAVDYCFNRGVATVVSAGNSDLDACNYTPAYAPNAITVGASDVEDVTASFTNFGTCLDLFAPGVDVKSTYLNGNTAVLSGTSMACPHVAGVCARKLGQEATSPADLADWLTSTATPNAINFRNGHESSPNLLLFADCAI